MQERIMFLWEKIKRESYPKIQAIKNAKAGRTLHMVDVKVAVVYFIPV